MTGINRDQTIDLLHAIMQQYDGNTVRLDGEEFFVEQVCESAIMYLENDTNTKEPCKICQQFSCDGCTYKYPMR